MTRALALLLSFTLLGAAAGARAGSEPAHTDHLVSRLVAESTAAVPGTRLTIGLLLEHEPHWHTYWINPGDSGLPTEIELVLPDGVTAEPIAWPHPQRFEVAGIVNYGYGDRALLPVTLAIPAGYAAATLPVRATANWLICEEECIPGEAAYAFELPVAGRAAVDERWVDAFAAARSAQPEHDDATLAVATDGDDIVLALGDVGPSPAAWTWFPETPEIVANGAGPRWQRAGSGWRARWPKSEYFTTLPTDPVFVAVDGDTGRARRFAGVAAVAAPAASPAAAVAPATGGFRAWIAGAVLLAAIVAILVFRTKPHSRPEEIDR